MGKLIKPGIFSELYGLPKQPKVGTTIVCRFCSAEWEVEENDLNVKLTIVTTADHRVPAYRVRCADENCRRYQIVDMETIPPEVYRELNKSRLEQLLGKGRRVH